MARAIKNTETNEVEKMINEIRDGENPDQLKFDDVRNLIFKDTAKQLGELDKEQRDSKD